jgi:hypothetical protein
LLDGGVDAMRKQFETNVFSLIGVTARCSRRQNKGSGGEYRQRSGVLVTPSPAPATPQRPPCML